MGSIGASAGGLLATASAVAIGEAIHEFHRTYDVPRGAAPQLLSDSRLDLRLRLIDEERSELRDAAEQGDIVEMADALGDIVYVCYGMAVEMGIDLDQVIAEIHRANMSKLGSDGRPIINDGVIDPGLPIGKVLKGPNYAPPDIAGVLDRQRERA